MQECKFLAKYPDFLFQPYFMRHISFVISYSVVNGPWRKVFLASVQSKTTAQLLVTAQIQWSEDPPKICELGLLWFLFPSRSPLHFWSSCEWKMPSHTVHLRLAAQEHALPEIRRSHSWKQKFGFIKWVDKFEITTVKDLESWCFER